MDTIVPHHRHSIRLKGFDYTLAGAYFITLVTHNRQSIFGEVAEAHMQLNAIGKIAAHEWVSLPTHFPFVQLDAFVIMPNHLHAVLVFLDPSVNGTTGPRNDSPTAPPNSPAGPTSGSLGAVIGQFKSRVTKRLWQLPDLKGVPIWQRNYYEHVIRDKIDFNNIILYIKANPEKWGEDKENPRGIDE